VPAWTRRRSSTAPNLTLLLNLFEDRDGRRAQWCHDGRQHARQIEVALIVPVRTDADAG
jgi:hypothetical protein